VSTGSNKAVVKEFVEAGNRGDVEGNVKYTALDCLLNGAPFGREGDRQRMLAMLDAFPDGQYRIDDLIAEGDKVVLH
jgi:predicted ester cyclase